ncbi:unnamed protein product [Phytophthora fragariaefolia]|uniref:Unnamed protein product n=1 Tax=Phytophthora fragariaefolia TaxID=1490495 RepID=A0A9W6XAS4_9STRA|nr:unnamed protein product [Phytophthora fragariaefolia]
MYLEPPNLSYCLCPKTPSTTFAPRSTSNDAPIACCVHQNVTVELGVVPKTCGYPDLPPIRTVYSYCDAIDHKHLIIASPAGGDMDSMFRCEFLINAVCIRSRPMDRTMAPTLVSLQMMTRWGARGLRGRFNGITSTGTQRSGYSAPSPSGLTVQMSLPGRRSCHHCTLISGPKLWSVSVILSPIL